MTIFSHELSLEMDKRKFEILVLRTEISDLYNYISHG